ncbi:hypothetical protein IMCC3317_37600 [Kordia antarctica]|uniref:Uncharacterized protein n=1 Tax=Kordia antarctica TaxID=1218801 RepID=A0A7L4ZNQ0_9FLAO|nr:hypothetical protein [Kordia antarctica]QHI38368.1 hypothetical protein IMCC3317_37600 [Kordia antarctica]
MKKRNLKSLALNKKSIADFTIKGGDNPIDTSGGSEHNPNSIDPKICFPKSDLPDTRCTCA